MALFTSEPQSFFYKKTNVIVQKMLNLGFGNLRNIFLKIIHFLVATRLYLWLSVLS